MKYKTFVFAGFPSLTAISVKVRSVTRKAIACALLSGVALGSNATEYNLGASIPGVPLSFNAIASGSPFFDFFKFSLPADNNGSGFSVIAFDVPGFFTTDLAAIALFSNADGDIGSGDDVVLGGDIAVAPGDFKSLGFSVGALPAGSYFLAVVGVTSGQFGGLYNGAISVTAVPEPESYALFLAGLGILGAVARRRNKAKSL